jgi:hypothetical protein
MPKQVSGGNNVPALRFANSASPLPRHPPSIRAPSYRRAKLDSAGAGQMLGAEQKQARAVLPGPAESGRLDERAQMATNGQSRQRWRDLRRCFAY